MRKGGAVVALATVIAGVMWFAAVAGAGQRVYISGFDDGTIVRGKVDSGGNINALPTLSTDSNSLEGIATSADGRHVLAVGFNDTTLYPFTIPKRGAPTAEKPKKFGIGGAYSVVVTPNGKYVYASATGDDRIAGFELRRDGSVKPTGQGKIATDSPTGLAVSPSGKLLFAVNNDTETVSTFAIRGNGKLDEVAGSPAPAGPNAYAISITPRGRDLYVADNNTPAFVHHYEVAKSGRLREPSESPYVESGDGTFGSVISPDGRRLYIANYSSETISGFAIDGDGQLGPLPGTAYAGPTKTAALAITANTSKLFAVSGDGAMATYDFDGDGAPINKALSVFGIPGDFQSITLSPAQPPMAKLKATVNGGKVKLDAGKSKDDGTIVEYAWKFGDGEKTFTMGPKVDHTYAKPGKYEVTVTLSDDDTCSTIFVSAGQTAYCNGSKRAKAAEKIKVK